MLTNRIITFINVFILLLAFYVGIFYESIFALGVSIIYVLVIQLVCFLTKKDTSVCKFIITIYLQIVGPIEILFVKITPISVIGYSYLKFSGLLEDSSLLWKYVLYSLLFYLLLVLVFELLSYKKKTIQPIERFSAIHCSPNDYIKNNKRFKFIPVYLWAFAVVFSIGYYFLRITYYLDVPGKNPLINYAGVIVYIFSFVKILILYKGLDFIAKKSSINFLSLLQGIVFIIVVNFSDILLDRRSSVFYSLIIFVFYIYVMKKYSLTSFLKKHWLLTIFGIFAIFGIFSFWTENVRYSNTENQVSYLYLFSRLVGLMPGLICLNYFGDFQNIKGFSIGDFFNNAFGARTDSINKIFTYEILNYPTTAIHRSAVPLFIGSLFYENVLGFVLFAVLFGAIFALSQRLIVSEQPISYANKHLNEGNAFIGCYITVYALFAIMNGNGEQLIDLFVIPLMFLVYNYVISLFAIKGVSYYAKLSNK